MFARSALPLAALAACLVSATVAASPKPRDSSWGKPGVAYDDYRNDAVECARLAAGMDVADTDAAQTLVAASRELEQISDVIGIEASGASLRDPTGDPQAALSVAAAANTYQRAMDRYRPDKQFDAIRDLQYQALESCLSQRGYVRFQLTKEQRSQLRKMKRGSNERRTFLHRLASDPAVLSRQRM